MFGLDFLLVVSKKRQGSHEVGFALGFLARLGRGPVKRVAADPNDVSESSHRGFLTFERSAFVFF